MKKYLNVICALSLAFPKLVFANSTIDASSWLYDRMSNANALGKSDPVFMHEKENNYKDVSFVFDEKKLKITKQTSKNSNICSVEYVSIKKTLSAYFMSNTTTNLYETLYKNNGVPIPHEINLIASIDPDNSCPSPYDEIIAIGDYLTIIDQDYIIFFKQVKNDEVKIDSLKNSNIFKFCKEENPGRIYDGIDSYACFFPDMGIQESYELLKNAYFYKQGVFKNILPGSNAEYKLDGNKINYHWESDTELTVTVTGDSESGSYIFNKLNSGTNVEIKSETQY
ncbi:hypothetical protein RIN58_12635 [Siccibacter colletis]|uniref:hypothetical protein n=1 Tax=Siccibacter colletis TaxID=1505757 RepID=UPI0028BE11FF|nr:hypothetical protein [Siccibacter colletis]WNN47260.1 hypothetical protein RIN58_12635 [Siccibacter colletis]